MNFVRKYVFLFIACIFILSCRDNFAKQQNDARKRSNVPQKQPASPKKSSNTDENQNKQHTPIKKEVEKKKNTATDTLKPIKVFP
jgi:hypothetical protein